MEIIKGKFFFPIPLSHILCTFLIYNFKVIQLHGHLKENSYEDFTNQQMTAGAGMSEYTGGVAKTVSMFSKLMNQGSALVVEGVNFVLKENVSVFRSECKFFFYLCKF